MFLTNIVLMKVGAFHFFPCHASNSKNVYFTKMKMNNMKNGFSNVLKQTYKKTKIGMIEIQHH